MKQKIIFITGGAGYVGAMLCDLYARRGDISLIVTVDKEERSDLIDELPEEFKKKIIYINSNLGDDGWQEKVSKYKPSVVIHTAWQIRELYGDKKTTWKWNIVGSDKVFDYVFDYSNDVEKLIYFSTVASYGAYKENTIEHSFTEEEKFRKTDYLYAEEKRIAEEHLFSKYEEAKKRGKCPEIDVLRPAAITGPRGRNGRIRFGLQSALSGKLEGGFAYSVVRGLTRVVPVTPKWCRQFLHEDDVAGIVSTLVFDEIHDGYYIYNICPPGDVVSGDDMAKAVGKKALHINPIAVRIPFFVLWHLSRGKISTSPGGWKSYSYPIVVDGRKITKERGYNYLFECKEAFNKYAGHYAEKYK